MATIVTEQDEMMHNGEELPILSASAKRMKIDKLLATPLPKYDGSVPGSYLWTKLAFWMIRRVSSARHPRGLFTMSLSTNNAMTEYGGPARRGRS